MPVVITKMLALPLLLLMYLVSFGVLWFLIKLSTKQSLPKLAAIIALPLSIVILIAIAPAI